MTAKTITLSFKFSIRCARPYEGVNKNFAIERDGEQEGQGKWTNSPSKLCQVSIDHVVSHTAHKAMYQSPCLTPHRNLTSATLLGSLLRRDGKIGKYMVDSINVFPYFLHALSRLLASTLEDDLGQSSTVVLIPKCGKAQISSA